MTYIDFLCTNDELKISGGGCQFSKCYFFLRIFCFIKYSETSCGIFLIKNQLPLNGNTFFKQNHMIAEYV